jgi:hypothetical protein
MTAASESPNIATQALWNEGRDLIPGEVKTGNPDEAAAGDDADCTTEIVSTGVAELADSVAGA